MTSQLPSAANTIPAIHHLHEFVEGITMPHSNALNSSEAGLEVASVENNTAFASRTVRAHSIDLQMQSMQRIARAFVEDPDVILQQLVHTAVTLCGADSAVISVVRENGGDDAFHQWIAIAGQCSPLLHATLPRYPSACTVALERRTPQVFRMRQQIFDRLGVQAPQVTDGLVIPWHIEALRGTIFIMAHGRVEAFDRTDCHIMQALADFASVAVQLLHKQDVLLKKARLSGAMEMANQLAHQINNPLQSLTNILFLAAGDKASTNAKMVVEQASAELSSLSMLVNHLLTLPSRRNHRPSRFSPGGGKSIHLRPKPIRQGGCS